MKKIKNLLVRPYSAYEKIIFLLILALVMRDAFIDVPYINLFIVDLENRAAIVWFMALLIFRPSIPKLLISSIVFLIILVFVLILVGKNSDYGVGLIVYMSFVLAAIKYPKK